MSEEIFNRRLGAARKSVGYDSHRECKQCKETFPLTKEYFYTSGIHFRRVCKECHRVKGRAAYHKNAKDPLWMEKQRERHKILRYERKERILKKYGYKCACCGETTREFLAIDHIDGGGRQHREKLGLAGGNFHLWIEQNNYPDILRLLCHNCNQSLGAYGYCPHQKEEIC